MLGLAFVGFIFSLLVSLLLIRHARRHALQYADGLPQRFHVGHIPRVGGVAIFTGVVFGVLAGPVLHAMGVSTNIPLTFKDWALWCVVLAPIVAGGVYEDLTARLSARWRLLITGGAAACAKAGATNRSVSRVGLIVSPRHNL